MARQKRIWRESQHPRDARGRFAKRGGAAWIKRAAAELSTSDATSAGGRPRISRNAKAGAVLQAHADGGRPSAVRVPKATITPAPSPKNLAMFNAQRLPTPVKRAAPTVDVARFMAPGAPTPPPAPKKRTPRPAPGVAALRASRGEEQAAIAPAMQAARAEPAKAPSAGAAGYAAMKRHTLVSLARAAGVQHRGKSNTEVGEALAAKDAEVKAARAARLNPSGVGKVDTPRVGSDNGGMTSTTKTPTWGEVRQVPASDLKPGDQFVRPATGMAYSTDRNGAVRPAGGTGFQPLEGTVWTVTARNGKTITARNADGKELSQEAPAGTKVLRVDEREQQYQAKKAERDAQEATRRAEHEATMEAQRAALRAKTPAGVRPGDGRPSIGTITGRTTSPREKWNLGNTPGTAGSAPNMVISPVGHIDNREANARIMNPLTPDGPYRYEIRDENTGEIIESGEDHDLNKVYAKANRIMSRSAGGGMARTAGKSTRFEARQTERPKDRSRGDFGSGPFYEYTVVEIDQDGNETVRVKTGSMAKAEANAAEMNAKELEANPRIPTTGRKQIPRDTKAALMASSGPLTRDGKPIEAKPRKTEAPPAESGPKYQTLFQRLGDGMTDADRREAYLKSEERRQQLRAQEAEAARLRAEARANDTRPEREKLAEQLQQDRAADSVSMRSGRRDPQRLARMKKIEARIEEIDTEARKAQIKGIRKGDKVTTTYKDETVEVEVVGKTSDGYLRVLLPDGRRGSLHPKFIEGTTPAPKADAAKAPEPAAEMPEADIDALIKGNGQYPDEFTLEQKRQWLEGYQKLHGTTKPQAQNDASPTVKALRDRIRGIEVGREFADVHGDRMGGDEDEQAREKLAARRELADLKAKLLEAERAERGYDSTPSKAFAGLSDSALERAIKAATPGTKKLEALRAERDARAAVRFKAARPKADAAKVAAGIDDLVKSVPDNRAAGTGKDRSGMMDQAKNPRILAEQWAAAVKTGDKVKATNAFVKLVHGIRLNGTGSREDRQALIERLSAEHDRSMGTPATPARARITPDAKRGALARPSTPKAEPTYNVKRGEVTWGAGPLKYHLVRTDPDGTRTTIGTGTPDEMKQRLWALEAELGEARPSAELQAELAKYRAKLAKYEASRLGTNRRMSDGEQMTRESIASREPKLARALREEAKSPVDTPRVKSQNGGMTTTKPGRVKPSEIQPGMMISANTYGFPRDGSPAEVARVEPGTRGGARIWLKGKESDEDVIGLSANARVDLASGSAPAKVATPVGPRERTGTYTGEISSDRKERFGDKALTDHAQALLISVDTDEQAAALGFGDSDAPVQVGDEVMIVTNRKLRRGIVTGTSRGGANNGQTRVMYSTPTGAHHFTETTQPTQEVRRLVDPSKRPGLDRTALLPKVAPEARGPRGRTEEQKQADKEAQKIRDAEYRAEENRRYIQEAEEWAADAYGIGGDRDPYSRITSNETALARMATTIGVPVPRLKSEREGLRRAVADAIIARVKEQDARVDAATSGDEVRDVLNGMGSSRLFALARKLGLTPDYKAKAPELRRLVSEALDGRGKA